MLFFSLKPHKTTFTIATIGDTRFCTGVVAGLMNAIAIAFLFKFFIRSTNISRIVNEEAESTLAFTKIHLYEALLLSFTAVSLGFSMTHYIWLSKTPLQKDRTHLHHRHAQTNGLFIWSLVLLLFIQFFNVFMQSNYAVFKIDLYKSYSYLPFLIPIWIYLFC